MMICLTKVGILTRRLKRIVLFAMRKNDGRCLNAATNGHCHSRFYRVRLELRAIRFELEIGDASTLLDGRCGLKVTAGMQRQQVALRLYTSLE